jgi:hypothetical protein
MGVGPNDIAFSTEFPYRPSCARRRKASKLLDQHRRCGAGRMKGQINMTEA